MDWPVRIVRLASDPQERGLWCGPEGLSLAGRPLVEEDESDFRPKSLRELQATLDDVYGADAQLDAQDFLPGLNTVARSLNKGDLPLAMIGSVLLKLPDIPALLMSKYSDDEDRDADGRWTDGGEGEVEELSPLETAPEEAPTLAPAEAEVVAQTERGVVARLAPRVLSLLGGLAEIASGPLAVAAGVLIPTNSSNIHYTDLPGFPGLSCRSDEGIVTISYLDAAADEVRELYHGSPDEQGFYHDADGYVIGQRVGTGVLFDNDALTELAAKGKIGTDTDETADGGPSPAATADGDDPEVCPLPTPENIAGRSRRSLAYQSQITGLLEGLDVQLNSVRFDGCDETTQRMIEAKGLGMEWMLNWPYDKLIQSKFYRNMMNQAERQNYASEGRGDDYYFADTRMEKFFSAEFEEAGYTNIKVHQVDAHVKKFIEYLKSLGTKPFIHRASNVTAFSTSREELK